MQLRVEKCDGSVEVYLHTKVMGSVAAALSDAGQYDGFLAEQLSEAVTLFLGHSYGCGVVSSDEIHAMIEAVLTDTGYVGAGLALQEHRIERQMKRRRTEVMHYSVTEPGEPTGQASREYLVEPWDKSAIVRRLEGERGLLHEVARATAGAAEEKILRMGCRCVTTGLVRELVEGEVLAMTRAQRAMAQEPGQQTRSLVAAAG